MIVDKKCAHPTLAQSAAVIGEFETDRGLAGFELIVSRHGKSLQRQEVVVVGRYTVLDIQRPAAEAAALSNDRAATEKLKPGKAMIRFEFAYDGGGLGKGGKGTLFVNDQKVAEGRIEQTQAMIFSADETADVGIDLATPVVETIGSEAKSRFTGRIPKVTVEVKEMKTADKAEAVKANAEVEYKKAMSN